MRSLRRSDSYSVLADACTQAKYSVLLPSPASSRPRPSAVFTCALCVSGKAYRNRSGGPSHEDAGGNQPPWMDAHAGSVQGPGGLRRRPHKDEAAGASNRSAPHLCVVSRSAPRRCVLCRACRTAVDSCIGEEKLEEQITTTSTWGLMR
jgi:hypothetical protein